MEELNRILELKLPETGGGHFVSLLSLCSVIYVTVPMTGCALDFYFFAFGNSEFFKTLAVTYFSLLNFQVSISFSSFHGGTLYASSRKLFYFGLQKY